MYSAKGFLSIENLIDNTPGVVSVMGELSSLSSSFAKEKGFYSNTNFPSLQFISFYSKEINGNVETDVRIPANIINAEFLPVANAFVDGIITDQLGDDLAALANQVSTAFSSTIKNVQFGQAVEVVVGPNIIQCPEWVSFEHLTNENSWKFWLIDESFRSQYDEYSIAVVPPFTPVSNFFLSGSQVETLLNNVSTVDLVGRMDTAKEGFPTSYIKVVEFDYHNPSKPTQTTFVKAKFGVLIWGEAGNNTDAIREAIADYLLAQTPDKTREDWVAILPDIFKRTEFIFRPMWESMAIPNRTLERGIYSPFNTLSGSLTQLTTEFPDIQPLHIQQHASSFTHTYKSLATLVVSNHDNRNNFYKLTDLFPDIIMVSTQSTDFNRMDVATQSFLIKLDTLIQLAEEATPRTSVPSSYSRVKRGDDLYVSMSIDNVQYLVYAKYNTED